MLCVDGGHFCSRLLQSTTLPTLLTAIVLLITVLPVVFLPTSVVVVAQDMLRPSSQQIHITNNNHHPFTRASGAPDAPLQTLPRSPPSGSQLPALDSNGGSALPRTFESSASAASRPQFLAQSQQPQSSPSSSGPPQPNTNLFPNWNGGRPIFGPNVGVLFNLTEFPATQPGKVIVMFNAYGNTPGDLEGSNYTFFITKSSDPNGMFSIGQKDGSLRVAGQLDREETDQYNLKIGARDEAGNIGFTSVTIYVDDLNDNAPTLVPQNNPVIRENMTPEVKIATIFGHDADSSANGPPFKFAEPLNSNVKNLFKLIYDPTLDNGNGGVEIWSRVKFDHEFAREYQIPILVSDSGTPPQSTVRYITVTVIDENDNSMMHTSKTIMVFNYKGQMARAPIGQVHIDDVEASSANGSGIEFSFVDDATTTNFDIDSSTGILYIKEKTPPRQYKFKVKAQLASGREPAGCNVTVNVEWLPEEALINSGSMRLQGISAEDFFSRTNRSSAYDRMRYKLAELLRIDKVNSADGGNLVQIFSIAPLKTHPPVLEVRFAAVANSRYKSATALNGLVQLRRREFGAFIGAQIIEVGINPCFTEKCQGLGGCTNMLMALDSSSLINVKNFSFVGVVTQSKAQCTCPRSVGLSNTCTKFTCLNGGICHDLGSNFFCECRNRSLAGSRCEGLTRSFNGQGYAWFPALPNCDQLQISFEFATKASDAMLFYNGPTDISDITAFEKPHFISLTMLKGKLLLQVDLGFGVGAMQFSEGKAPVLNDGEWHSIDIRRSRETLELTVDKCRNVRSSSRRNRDISSCKLIGQIPGPVDVLSISAPFQVGGLATSLEANYPTTIPRMPAFDGCIRELRINNELFDMANPAVEDRTEFGCSQTAAFCAGNSSNSEQSLCENGECRASFNGVAQCLCQPGFHGQRCSEPSSWSHFNQKSYIQYQFTDPKLSDPLSSNVKILLLAESPTATVFLGGASDTSISGGGFSTLEVEDSVARFRYGSNARGGSYVSLPNVRLYKNQSYSVHVERYNAYAKMSLDDHVFPFEVESFENDSTALFGINTQNLILGAESSNTLQDFTGCISDFWWNGFFIPTEEVVAAQTPYLKIESKVNVDAGCPLIRTCASVPTLCQFPYVCADHWKGAYCTCAPGIPALLDDFGTIASCQAEGFVNQEDLGLGITSGAIIAIVISSLVLIVLVLFLIVWVTRHRRPVVYPSSESDTFDNIVNYLEEGGGEDDQHAYDISHLRRPVLTDGKDDSTQENISRKPVIPGSTEFLPAAKQPYSADKYGGIKDFLSDRLGDADIDPMAPPFDELRQYDYEGDGMSAASSLSSLSSVGQDGVDWDERLNSWGPRFQHLAELCGGDDEET